MLYWQSVHQFPDSSGGKRQDFILFLNRVEKKASMRPTWHKNPWQYVHTIEVSAKKRKISPTHKNASWKETWRLFSWCVLVRVRGLIKQPPKPASTLSVVFGVFLELWPELVWKNIYFVPFKACWCFQDLWDQKTEVMLTTQNREAGAYLYFPKLKQHILTPNPTRAHAQGLLTFIF